MLCCQPSSCSPAPSLASEILAQWALVHDLDEREVLALESARIGPHFLRLAWQPVALFGPGAHRQALRKLRRAAMASAQARSIAAELGWDALGYDGALIQAMTESMQALQALCEPLRLRQLWGALDRERPRAEPGEEEWVKACLRKVGSDSRVMLNARRRGWSAVADADWETQEDEERALRTWSMIEKKSMTESSEAAKRSKEVHRL